MLGTCVIERYYRLWRIRPCADNKSHKQAYFYVSFKNVINVDYLCVVFRLIIIIDYTLDYIKELIITQGLGGAFGKGLGCQSLGWWFMSLLCQIEKKASASFQP